MDPANASRGQRRSHHDPVTNWRERERDGERAERFQTYGIMLNYTLIMQRHISTSIPIHQARANSDERAPPPRLPYLDTKSKSRLARRTSYIFPLLLFRRASNLLFRPPLVVSPNACHRSHAPRPPQFFPHISRYLVDRGAAVNDGNPGGESVLDMAKRFSGAELQRYLAAKVLLLYNYLELVDFALATWYSY